MPPLAHPTFWDKKNCRHTYVSPKSDGNLSGFEDETELECPGSGENKDKALGDKYGGTKAPAAQEAEEAPQPPAAAFIQYDFNPPKDKEGNVIPADEYVNSSYSKTYSMPPLDNPIFWDKKGCKHTYISPKTWGDLAGFED